MFHQAERLPDAMKFADEVLTCGNFGRSVYLFQNVPS
jgi:hypothetical protein